jgi:inhibitor of KinA
MMRLYSMGDSALVVEFGGQADEPTHYRVQAARHLLEAPPVPGIIEVVPGFTTLTLYYDILALRAACPPGEKLLEFLEKRIESRLAKLPAVIEARPSRTVEIPVCYGGKFGPDLEEVAKRLGLGTQEVIQHHHSAEYLVYLLGFSPGFPYLGGLPETLALPRRTTPRVSVPPGSVGIVNRQSCIYPMATPGGWNLIGRTPLRLFRPEADSITLLRAGDRVRFRPITPDEFVNWKEQS